MSVPAVLLLVLLIVAAGKEDYDSRVESWILLPFIAWWFNSWFKDVGSRLHFSNLLSRLCLDPYARKSIPKRILELTCKPRLDRSMKMHCGSSLWELISWVMKVTARQDIGWLLVLVLPVLHFSWEWLTVPALRIRNESERWDTFSW